MLDRRVFSYRLNEYIGKIKCLLGLHEWKKAERKRTGDGCIPKKRNTLRKSHPIEYMDKCKRCGKDRGLSWKPPSKFFNER